MTHEEKFTSLLGSLSGSEQAFMISIPSNIGNPVKMLSRKVPQGAKVKIDGSTMYVKAPEFTHQDAVLLQVS
jgi:hypothetical protein